MKTKIKIIIVDDDVGLNRLISKSLTKKGFQVASAHSIQEALQVIQGDTQEILLIDYQLGDGTGRELIDQLKETHEQIPCFVIMTGFGDEKVAVEMMKLGARDYLVKDADFLDVLGEKLRYVFLDLEKDQKLNQTAKELKRSNDLLYETGKIARVGGWELNLKQATVFVTDSFKEIFPDLDGSPIPLDEFSTLFSNEESMSLTDLIHQHADAKTSFDIEIPVQIINGSISWLHIIGRPVLKAGKCISFSGVIQDVTPHKASEQKLNFMIQQLQASEQQLIATNQQLSASEKELQLALEKAQESDRLKTAFLANMSHEIRTPMNGIVGFVNLIAESNLSSEDRERYADIVNQCSKRLLNTINDLIDISRIEAGQVTLHEENTNINKILREIKRFFSPEARAKGLKIVLQMHKEDQDACLITDNDKVYGILANLVKNAIKYTETGSIRIGYGPMDGAAQKVVRFYVEDTGIGIPEARQKAIFNRFEQADIEDTRVYEGSGLGLAIAKAYTEMLGGEIWVDSTPGKGSVFSFNIDCKRPTNSELAECSEANNMAQIGDHMKDLTILVAEDDQSSLVFFKTILQDLAKNVYYASDGQQAVEMCQSNPDIDVLLLDIKMPVMNGYEVAREIRKTNKDLIIIAQTAFALIGDREKALKAGCNEFLTKPIQVAELFDKINLFDY